MNIAIVLFPDVEELDFAGPYEVFGMAAKWMYKDWRLFTVAEAGEVKGSCGLRVLADYTFDNAPKADLIVVPGGVGTRAGAENAKLIGYIKQAGAGAEYVTSVCTGAFLLAETGLLDGVTTNPSLVAKEGGDFKATIKEICQVVEGPVSAEVTATEAGKMVEEGRTLAKIADNVTVKVPLTWDGLKACRELSSRGIPINMTLCFSANQALLAAKAGATFISPFIGRLDDAGQDGMALIREIRQIYADLPLSIVELPDLPRHVTHVRDAALAGADVATMPVGIFKQLVYHPLTDKGLAAFLEDWKKTGQSIL